MAPKPEPPTRAGKVATIETGRGGLVAYPQYEEELLPRVNADGLPVVAMSDELQYEFDVRGWITLPSLLTDSTPKRSWRPSGSTSLR